MATRSPDGVQGWELPLCNSHIDTKEDFEDLLSKLRHVHARVCARNTFLESRQTRISGDQAARDGFNPMPVPQEWATSSEVRTMIGKLETNPDQHKDNKFRISFNETGLAVESKKNKLSVTGARRTSFDPQLEELGPEGLKERSSGRNSGFATASSISRQSQASISSSASKARWRVTQGTTKDLRPLSVQIDSIPKKIDNVRSCLDCLVNSKYFIATYSSILFSYAIFIAIETELLALNPGKEWKIMMVVHITYSCLFTIELFIRLGAEGCRFFCGKGALFNWFDTGLVVSTVVDLILEIWSANLSNVATAGPIMRTLRIIRVVRTMRLVRTFTHLHEFQKMAFALASSLKTLFCSVLVVSFVMFFFAVIFTQGAADLTLRDDIQDLKVRYGDLSATMYTLFLSVSAGISWDSAYTPLSELGAGFGYAFILYIILSLFGILNVVNSIFVESVIRSAQHHREVIVQDKEKEKFVALSHMQEVFRAVDIDGSGHVTADELEYFLSKPDLKKYMEALDVSPEDTHLLFKLLDQDGSSVVDVDEFCEGCLRLKGSARSIDVQTLIFQMKRFLVRWGEFTDYVAERFDLLQIPDIPVRSSASAS